MIPGGDKDVGWPVRAPTGIGRLAIVALHLVPGVVAYALLHLARRPLSEALGVSEATAQIGMMTAVMFSMAVTAFLIPVKAERRSLPETVGVIGLRRWDPGGLILAGVFALVLLVLPTERWYEQGLAEWLQGIELLDLDRWHFQETGAFLEVPALVRRRRPISQHRRGGAVVSRLPPAEAVPPPLMGVARGRAVVYGLPHLRGAHGLPQVPGWSRAGRTVRTSARHMVMHDVARTSASTDLIRRGKPDVDWRRVSR